jgi:hypothetical protein
MIVNEQSYNESQQDEQLKNDQSFSTTGNEKKIFCDDDIAKLIRLCWQTNAD